MVLAAGIGKERRAGAYSEKTNAFVHIAEPKPGAEIVAGVYRAKSR